MFENEFDRLPWPAFIARLLKNIYRFGILVIVYAYGAIKNDAHPASFMAGFIGAFLLLTAIPAVLNQFTFKLKVSAEQIQIKKGILNRQELDIPYSRMQSVKEKQWFFFAPFNLTQITIETAAGDTGQAEVELVAVPVALAKLIDERRKAAIAGVSVASEPNVAPTMDDASDGESIANDGPLNSVNAQTHHVEAEAMTDTETVSETTQVVPSTKPQPVAAAPSTAKPVYQISIKQIILFSLTDLTMMLTVFVFLEFLDRYFDDFFRTILSDADGLVKGSIVVLISVVALILLFIAICSFVKSFYKYNQFQVFKTAEDLTIELGLLARNRIIIPISKIQGIEIKQSLLRKIFKLSSVKLILATGNNDDDNKTVYLLPIINDGEVLTVLQELLPAWQFQAMSYQKNAHPKVWYFIRWRLIFGAVASVAAFYFSWIAGIVVVLGLILILGAGIWESRVQGYQILDEHHLSVQSVAVITRTQSFLARSKIQALQRRTSMWLTKKKLSSLTMTVKAGDSTFTADLNFFSDADNDVVQTWYLKH